MAKQKPTTQATARKLSSYKFDTSTYIVLDTGVRRDATTGRLVSREPAVAMEKHKK